LAVVWSNVRGGTDGGCSLDSDERHTCGVILGAATQREPALSAAEGDLARITKKR